VKRSSLALQRLAVQRLRYGPQQDDRRTELQSLGLPTREQDESDGRVYIPEPTTPDELLVVMGLLPAEWERTRACWADHSG
jgi:hypothetical protein